MASVNRPELERLKYSVQFLACPAEIQLKMLPDFVCKADELALEFDQWRHVVLDSLSSELTAAQRSSLDAIDASLSEMTEPGSCLWTEDAVRKSSHWANLRAQAATALESFGWPSETPPSHADEFISGR